MDYIPSKHRDIPNLFLNRNKNTFFFILLFGILLVLFSCKSSKKHSKGRSYKSRTEQKKSEPSSMELDERVEKVIHAARSYIGTSYKYGGTTKAGMDCSGLMGASFRSVDIQLPRTSDEQSRKGMRVNLKDIQEGDLVFFTDKKGHKNITHVGLVTEVKNKDFIKFIHSSTKLGVVEDNLFADYYISIFVKAVRLF